MTSHDQLSKSLIRTFFADFLRLVVPEFAHRLQTGDTVFLDKEAFTDWPAGDRREMDRNRDAAGGGADETGGAPADRATL